MRQFNSSSRFRFRLPFTPIAAWLIYVFLLMPNLIVIPMSFGGSNELMFPPTSWSFDLYRRMMDPSSGWLSAAQRSFEIGTLATICAVVLGVPAAYGLARGSFPGKKALGFLLLSPIFAPTIVVALALYLYFAHLGLSGTLLGLVMGHTLEITPFVIVTALAGIRHLDPNVEIAATVMGASRFQVFYKVVLPLLRPSIMAGALFAFLLSFDEVVISWFVGGSGQPTLPVKMYSSIQWEISPVLAAISTVLVVITVAICVVAARLQPEETPRE